MPPDDLSTESLNGDLQSLSERMNAAFKAMYADILKDMLYDNPSSNAFWGLSSTLTSGTVALEMETVDQQEMP